MLFNKISPMLHGDSSKMKYPCQYNRTGVRHDSLFINEPKFKGKKKKASDILASF